MFLRIFLVLSLIITFISCTKNEKPIYESVEKVDPYDLYQEGLDSFKKNDFFFASKKFSQAELNFKDIDLAAKSAVMASYALYGMNFYEEALDSLKIYLKTYPLDKNVIYAHYLIAIIHFEQITDEKKDLKPILNASEKINFFLEKYPNTDYSIDLKFKKNLIENQLAAKEMYVARYYISVQKWVPAINRLKIIIKKYDKTIFIEEALHRLVEIHYHLGLQNEAKKYASILGYNYNSSEWFKQSYKVLNKDYDFKKEIKVSNETKNKTNFFKRIIKMIK
jgi:outer membrane protein assembly factor BamD